MKLKGAEILELHYEIDDDPADALIPKTMHPAIPAYAIINVMHVPDSPAGEFTVARCGLRAAPACPRADLCCEASATVKRRGRSWERDGVSVAAADVSLTLRHDRVVGKVVLDGKTILQAELMDRDFISGNDIQYIASMHLARNADDQKMILVQVDPGYTFSKAERGKPNLITLDEDAFGAGSNLRVMNPIMASFATAEMTLPKIRYICNPEVPAMQGTTKVAA